MDKLSLKLYIAGMSSRSMTAIETVRRVCEEEVDGACDLQVIDIYKEPKVAREKQIIAVPTLIRESPNPMRAIIGDLSKPNRIRAMLGLDTALETEGKTAHATTRNPSR